MDYYASLGVARTSEDVVIRAAYLALMRRYHPDRNSTSEAAERVREITGAYDVLGDPVRRREYDRDCEPEDPNEFRGTKRRAPAVGPMAFAVTMVCAILLIWIVWAQKPSPELPSKVVEAAIRPKPTNHAQPDVSCSSVQSSNLISGELLRQASRIRANSQPLFAGLPAKFTVRTLPVTSLGFVSPGTIACSAIVTIRLPRGLIHPDGRRSLAGNIDYSIDVDQPGHGSSIQVTADDKFLLELASLESSTSTASAVQAKEQADNIPQETLRSQAPSPPRPALQPRSPSAIAIPARARPRIVEPLPARERPSISIAQPRCQSGDHWTRLICADANLTALNHQVAVFENQSVANAFGEKRELLRKSRVQFDLNRASCRTEACVQRTLVARTVELAGIMKSQTRPEQR